MADTTSPQERLAREARETLKRNAIECTNYIALGDVLANDLAKKYGLPLPAVRGQLAQIAVSITDDIRRI